VTLGQCIKELVRRHGGLRPTARALRVDVGYLSRLSRGKKEYPSKAVQRKLGVRAVTRYEWIKP
jgi:hypothetical protein